MNAFPNNFTPNLLLQNSENFQKQTQELRSLIMKNLDPLSGSCVIKIDQYGPPVIQLITKELTDRGFVVSVNDVIVKSQIEKIMNVSINP